jgi:hypothetical protein
MVRQRDTQAKRHVLKIRLTAWGRSLSKPVVKLAEQGIGMIGMILKHMSTRPNMLFIEKNIINIF